MKRDNSKFRAGSGCYTCLACGKKTRDTGNDEANAELCRSCYDEGGAENAHSDEGHKNDPQEDCPICKREGLLDKAPEVNSVGHLCGTLETKLGTVQWTLTEGRHVFIGTSSAQSEPGDREIELRGVRYYFSLHLFLQEDGSWDLRKDDRLYLSRSDFGEPSDPAKRDVKATFLAAWNEFIPGKEHLQVAAEKEHLQDRDESLAEKQKELEKELFDLKAERAFIEADLTRLSNAKGLPEKREPVYTG